MRKSVIKGFRNFAAILTVVISVFLFAGRAMAADICVSDAAGLQAALTTAAGNGQDDTIRIVQGTYVGSFIYSSLTEAYDLAIEGGYTAGCASRVVDPANTVLDGNNAGNVLILSTSQLVDFSVEGLTIRNGATAGDGGGIYIYLTRGNISLNKNIITNNSAASNGGGLSILPSTVGRPGIKDVILTGNIITNNSAASNGGGLYFDYIDEGTTLINNNVITDNSADNRGGGIYIRGWFFKKINLTNNIVGNNSSVSDGGGIYIYADNGILGASIDLRRNTVVNNNGNNGKGGGIYIYARLRPIFSSVKLINNLINHNNGDNGGGVYLYSYDGPTTLTSNTIADNTADSSGGGISLRLDNDTASADIYNNIIWSNSAAAEGADLYIENDANNNFLPSTVNLFNNDFDHSASGAYIKLPFAIDPTNLNNVDPLFVNPAGGDYRLQAGSPAIDAGDNRAPALPLTDLDGNGRINNLVVDTGAYEYQSGLLPSLCVSSVSELKSALVIAKRDGVDNTIQIVQGTYSGHFVYRFVEPYNIAFEGGYTAGCVSRVVDPANTILDGYNSGRILDLNPSQAVNFSVDGLTFRRGLTGAAGGILHINYSVNSGNTVTISNSIFSDNNPDIADGAEVYINSAGTILFTGNIINNNTNGHAVYIENSTTSDIAGNIISDNSANGVTIVNSGTATLTDNAISNNGNNAVYIKNSTTSDIAGNIISDNSANGVTIVNSGTATLTDNAISNNGNNAVYIKNSTTSDIAGNTISNNSAHGVTIVGPGAATVTGNSIIGNSGAYYGSGVYIKNLDTISLVNNVIAGNTATDGGAGIYIDRSAAITLTNNTVTGNSASYGVGEGLYITLFPDSATADIYNNIIWNNGRDLIHINNDADNNSVPSIVNIFNNDLSAVYFKIPFTIDASNLKNVDPLFADPVKGDYHLQAGSPVIDIGDNNAPLLPATDKDGNPRIINGIVDMGAYEYGGRFIYFDDFNDGNDNGWTVKSGTWEVIGGQYRETSSYSLPGVSVVDNPTSDMTIGIRARELGTGGFRNFFIVFAYDEANGKAYWAGARIGNVPPGAWTIEEIDLGTGSSSRLAEAPENIYVNTWYDLKLQISGDTVTLYADGTEKVSYTFPGGMPEGRIGLGGQNNQALFDDFVIDTDGDGIGDDGDGSGVLGDNRCTGGNTADCDDNCRLTANSGQQDTDADGYGNMCDADLDNDGFVGIFDFNIFKAAWLTNPSSANWNADADLDSDNFVGIFDFNIFKARWLTSAPWE